MGIISIQEGLCYRCSERVMEWNGKLTRRILKVTGRVGYGKYKKCQSAFRFDDNRDKQDI